MPSAWGSQEGVGGNGSLSEVCNGESKVSGKAAPPPYIFCACSVLLPCAHLKLAQTLVIDLMRSLDDRQDAANLQIAILSFINVLINYKAGEVRLVV